MQCPEVCQFQHSLSKGESCVHQLYMIAVEVRLIDSKNQLQHLCQNARNGSR